MPPNRARRSPKTPKPTFKASETIPRRLAHGADRGVALSKTPPGSVAQQARAGTVPGRARVTTRARLPRPCGRISPTSKCTRN
jgi:hypothetical protein